MQYLFVASLGSRQFAAKRVVARVARHEHARGPHDPHAPARRPRTACLLAVSLALWLTAPSARADVAARQLSVLRAAALDVDRADRAYLDAALHEALLHLSEFSRIDTLPVPLEDVQLAAGCAAAVPTHAERRAQTGGACLRVMAQQLEPGVLLVRELSARADGSVLLTLLVQDTVLVSAEPWRAEAVLQHASAPDSARTVQRLVTQLFPQSLLLASTPASSEIPHQDGRPVASVSRQWSLGWTVSAVGAGLLVAGLTSAVLSRRDERSYARTDIVDELDVDRAHARLGRAERRARIANVLIGTGAATASVGIAALFWRWAVLRPDASTASLSIQPTTAGAMLVLDGVWRGGR